ncbi:abortive phage resistance protein (plasmid) [Roseibium aggregatum]|uniref:abortive infection family protein n=1 Tax=Roseibium aggregatum TaxID=187304 RepID=UPI001E3987A8|nr:abortive infection family protein [Roseibium aggregatum]UES60237.1 abortive phage resistance protein [Roseibium aggregatum]
MFSGFEEEDLPDSPLDRALYLQNILLSVAENGTLSQPAYTVLRRELMQSDARDILPEVVRTCRDHGSVWGYLKGVASGSGSWDARRNHIYEAFTPLLDHLEGRNRSPADSTISEALSSFDTEGVHRVWERALQRRHEDPEGAITAARTLLETVCKHILDDAEEDYGDDDLPKLYSKVAKVLNLSPSQHTEQTFKSILGGCHTVVQNLGTLRNRIGDAHGQGRNPVRVAPRHAALAVNLAGSMATFIIETWSARQANTDRGRA